MQLIDNLNSTVRDALAQDLHKGGRLSIAAAAFSIYAYRELREQLAEIDELRFIFTSPTFTTEKTPKAAREFYIPRLSRERGVCGTEFEVRLKNDLSQRAIARECADWLRRKATFKSNVSSAQVSGFLATDSSVYAPFDEFTTTSLGCESGKPIYSIVPRMDAPEHVAAYLRLFDQLWSDANLMQDVTESVVESIAAAYRENAPDFIYFFTLYNIFHEFLNDVSEDELPNEATGFRDSKIWKMLYNFQRDAVLAIINKLEKFNGCILADSVGLGKTFTALAVIKYYESRNKSVLVLCPKKLAANWKTYKENYVNNTLAADRLRYDVLFHTDLSRDHGESNGIDLERVNWGNYDLVVVDESHNFRNGVKQKDDGYENRYSRLRDHVIRAGVKTKVLMLSATPVNNRFRDLKWQLELAHDGDADGLRAKLGTVHSVDEIFKLAQKAFNDWNKYSADSRTTDALLKLLDPDFFKLLDSVTIARSRKYIEKYYDMTDIGKFPTRLAPISFRPSLTDLAGAPNYREIYDALTRLNLCVYTPSVYLHPSRADRYLQTTGKKGSRANLTRAGREAGISRLMRVNLLKRLESSVQAFQTTLARVHDFIQSNLDRIDAYELHPNESQVIDGSGIADDALAAMDFDDQDEAADLFSVGRRTPIRLADMDRSSWRRALKKDAEILSGLIAKMSPITPEHDAKLMLLCQFIREKIASPFNPGNRKLLVFTAFADTADYLYENLDRLLRKECNLEFAEVTGSNNPKTTVPGIRADLNPILTCFSPRSKERDVLMPGSTDEIDVLVATDCISEGQNLQDCDCVVNYDIHWNPVRIVQRFGRVDRIGSTNAKIQLVNFWPDVNLDEYINLKSRVETRMQIGDLTGAGEGNPLDADEKGDLEYRRKQLERLQKEAVDLEDVSGGVSILDLGLNEFRLDLLAYLKTHSDMESVPKGIHAVAAATPDAPPGVIFILRNVNDSVNVDERNRIHPFYMVYVAEDGSVVRNHLDPRKLLDAMRLLCRGKTEPIKDLCRAFNEETDDGRKMESVSALLGHAVESIVTVKEKSDWGSLYRPGGTSALLSEVSGLDDFELVCFLVVKEAK